MIKIDRLSQCDRGEFVKKLEFILVDKFNCLIEELPKNYGRSWYWGLLSLIENDVIDDYYLLYYNDKIWAASGGIIRNYKNELIYQAAFRGFSCASIQYRGIGMKSLLHKHVTSEQIIDAKKKQCDKVIISFNIHNSKLFHVTHKYIMPRALPGVAWTISDSPTIFNKVEQFLMVHDIRNHETKTQTAVMS